MTVEGTRPPDRETFRDADAAFSRFCTEGASEALALVFDRTAPRLLLVAVGLARDSADAEDLVQTTYIEAIRSAGRFRPGSPVMPWLVTILARRAANLHRDQSRREQPGPEVEPVANHAADPAALAGSREIEQQVAAAIERVPTPFREVCTMRLFEGLRPAEIARALDRPAGTVHAQLHRGLERLRAALPAGLGAALAVALTGRGLHAMRAQVLAAAGSAVPPMVGWTLGGLTVKKVLAAAAVLVAALTALLWYDPHAPGGDPSVGGSTLIAGAQVAGRADEQRPRASTRGPARIGRRRIATQEIRPSLFSGRALSAESGAPLAGAQVTLGVGGLGCPHDWPVPEPVTSDAEGRFEITAVVPPEATALLTVGVPGRISMNGRWEEVRDGIRIDVGDVPLMEALPVTVRVVDESTHPVPGLGLQARLSSASLLGDTHEPYSTATMSPLVEAGTCGLLTGQDGRVRLPLYEQDWKIEVDPKNPFGYRGHSLVVKARTGTALRERRLRVETPDQDRGIEGVVVDEAGRALEGVMLVDDRQARIGDDHGVRSGPGGRFRFAEWRSGRRLAVDYQPAMRRYEILSPRWPLEKGTQALRVVVRVAEVVPLTLVVTDEASRPVQRFRFSLVPVRRGRHTLPLPGSGLWHAGGAATQSFLSGRHRLYLFADDPTLAPVVGREIVLGGGRSQHMRIQLEGRCAIQARVVDRKGRPVAGSNVKLLQACSDGELTVRTRCLSAEDAAGARSMASRLVVATAEAITDEEGLARLGAAPAPARGALLAYGDHHAARLVEIAVRDGAAFDVTVTRTAVIAGRLRPSGVVTGWGPEPAQRAKMMVSRRAPTLVGQRLPEVYAELVGQPGEWLSVTSVNEDGTFRIGGLEPGDYRVRFIAHQPRTSSSFAEEIAVVRSLVGGETRKIEIERPQLIPGRIRGKVLDGQGVARKAIVRFDGPEDYRGSVYTDRDGRFETGPLRGTLYVPRFGYRDGDGVERHIVAPPVRVEPNEVTEVTLVACESTALCVRLRRADGSVAEGGVAVVIPDELGPIELDFREPDDTGLVRFDRLPAAAVELRWHPREDAPLVRLGTFRGTTGEPRVFDVTVPHHR